MKYTDFLTFKTNHPGFCPVCSQEEGWAGSALDPVRQSGESVIVREYQCEDCGTQWTEALRD